MKGSRFRFELGNPGRLAPAINTFVTTGYIDLTLWIFVCNNRLAEWQYHLIAQSRRRMPLMEALIAAGAFLGLFSLWVLVPKVFLKK